MVKRYVYVCLIVMLIASLAYGAEVRKITRQDIEWTSPTYPSADCTVTSAGGHVGNVLDNTFKRNFSANIRLGPAGNETMTGTYNFLAGDGAGAAITSAGSSAGANIAIGKDALKSATTGVFHVAIGDNAAAAVTTNSHTVAVGFQTLSQSTAEENVAVGSVALRRNTTGSNNAAFGNDSLTYNTTGSNNSAFGQFALVNHLTGDNNTAVGHSAGNFDNTGTHNSYFGYAAWNNYTGNYNTMIGSTTGGGNTTGSYNTHLGYGAGSAVGATNLQRSLALGADAIVNCDSCAAIGPDADDGGTVFKVGIGFKTPRYPLDLIGDANITGSVGIGGDKTTSALGPGAKLNVDGTISVQDNNAIFWGTNTNTKLVYDSGPGYFTQQAFNGHYWNTYDGGYVNKMSLSNTGLTVVSLAGSGSRAVNVDANGLLSAGASAAGSVSGPATVTANNVVTWDADNTAINDGGVALSALATLASPTFTGTVTIPTPFTLGAVSVTATGDELNYVDGVTSAIQDQLDSKSDTTGNVSINTVGTITQGTWNATDIAVSAGGTGASTAADARTNLGLGASDNVSFNTVTAELIGTCTPTDNDCFVEVVNTGPLAAAYQAAGRLSFDNAAQCFTSRNNDNTITFSAGCMVKTFSFAIDNVIASDNVLLTRVPRAWTITRADCYASTDNVVGSLMECSTSDVTSCTVLDSWTVTNAASPFTDSSMSDGAVAAGAWIRWSTTSVGTTNSNKLSCAIQYRD